MNSDALLGEAGNPEELGAMEHVHDEGDGGDISHIGGFSGAGTASDDTPDTAKVSATQDPGSPLVENVPEVLSVGMTGHSLDSWYSLAKSYG